MIHCGFVPTIEVSRRPSAACGRQNCRRGMMRNWPIMSQGQRPMSMDNFMSQGQRPMSMDTFMNDLVTPISVLMAAFDPETCEKMSTLAPGAGSGAGDKKNEVVLTTNKFQINLNIDGYTPEELSVKTVDNFITIEGKHEEKSENSQVSRSFSRKWAIPEGVRVEEINCHLNAKDGILQLEAPRTAPQAKMVENMIPIQIQKENTAPSSTQEQDQGETDKNPEKMAE